MNIAVRQKAYLGVDVFLNFMPKKLSQYVRLMGELITIGTYCFLTYSACALVTLMKQGGKTLPALGIPIWIVYSSLLVGFILCVLKSIFGIYKDYFQKKKGNQRRRLRQNDSGAISGSSAATVAAIVAIMVPAMLVLILLMAVPGIITFLQSLNIRKIKNNYKREAFQKNLQYWKGLSF